MRLYAITDRRLLPGAHDDGRLSVAERGGLVRLAAEWASGGVEFVQLREKDLPLPMLADLAGELVAAIRGADPGGRTRLLVNAGTPIVLEGVLNVIRTSQAAGVHLSGRWRTEQVGVACVTGMVSVACHSVGEVSVAQAARADLALVSSIFPTESHPGTHALGLEVLAAACRAAEAMPVFALGGVDAANAVDCEAAGAAGVAGIRMFMTGGWRGL
jgi:thiamine-phosphate pyrophosphorylase